MIIKDVPVPEIYTESSDFRFFIDWFSESLGKLEFLHTNFFDLYDPLRCPEWLIWALCDTMGYKYDDRLPTSFNRLVLLYFMSMIHNRGSRDGVMLAAQTNLAQFNILKRAQGYKDDITGRIYPPKEILYNRLEDTSIPVNSVYISVDSEKGYIDVVYFADKVPLDACIEYVRCVGMYCFQHAGVRFDTETKMAFMDARLTDTRDVGVSFGPTHVGHYRRRDYATMQLTRERLDDTQPTFRIKRIPNTTAGKWFIQEEIDNGDGTLYWETIFGPFNAESHAKAHFDSHIIERRHDRENVWYRNRESESGAFVPPVSTAPASFRYTVNGEEYVMNPGYRTMYSLQLCNNENIVQSLFDQPLFSLGYGPQDFQIKNYEDDYIKYPYRDKYTGCTVCGAALGNQHSVECKLNGGWSDTTYVNINQVFEPWNYRDNDPTLIRPNTTDEVDNPLRDDPVIDRYGRRHWETNRPYERKIGRKAYNLRYNRDLDESIMEPKTGYHEAINTVEGKKYPIEYFDTYDTYAIEGEADQWYILKNGERLEPGKTYKERRVAEIRLAIVVPPDIYTVDTSHVKNSSRTDINDMGTAAYEDERIGDSDNRTKGRPVVNNIMATLGDAIMMVPDIDGEYNREGHVVAKHDGTDIGVGTQITVPPKQSNEQDTISDRDSVTGRPTPERKIRKKKTDDE